MTVALAGSYLQPDDSVNLENLQIGSESLKVRATGGVRSLQTTADLNLHGEAQCDWSRLSRLLTPYFGSNVRIEGQDTHQFAVRGPIGEVVNRRTSSTAVAAAAPADTLAWIKPLTAEGGIGWQRASVYGMEMGQGEIAADLRDGVLSVRPVELAVSGGKVRLFPKAILTPTPAVLIQERGKLIERVRVSPEMTATWLKYIAPAAAEATETQGELSLDLDGAKIPLFKPETADIGGRLEVHSLQVSPGPTARAFILLAEQIRALVERRPPPVELSRNPTLLAINDQQIVFRMLDGRVYHQGMTMNVGNVTIRTHGLVGLDESLNLVADVPVKAEWFGGGAVPAGLKDQTFQIPIGGTLRQPGSIPAQCSRSSQPLRKRRPRRGREPD